MKDEYRAAREMVIDGARLGFPVDGSRAARIFAHADQAVIDRMYENFTRVCTDMKILDADKIAE